MGKTQEKCRVRKWSRYPRIMQYQGYFKFKIFERKILEWKPKSANKTELLAVQIMIMQHDA
jgi:hypothetical protein